MSTIAARDGTRLFVRDWGSGTPVLFVASASLPSDIWGPAIPRFLDAGHRCIAFDRRGHGRSDEPNTGYDIDTLASDIACVAEKLGLSRFAVVGHSLGGMEAVRYAVHLGAKQVEKVVLLAPVAPYLLATPDNPTGIDRAIFDATAAEWRADFPRWVRENARAFFAPETSDAMLAWGATMMTALPLQVQLATARVVMETDLRDDLRQLKPPALFMHGALDASIPIAFGRLAAGLIPRCRFIELPDAAHGLFLTHPERVWREVLAFLSSG